MYLCPSNTSLAKRYTDLHTNSHFITTIQADNHATHIHTTINSVGGCTATSYLPLKQTTN